MFQEIRGQTGLRFSDSILAVSLLSLHDLGRAASPLAAAARKGLRALPGIMASQL